MNLRDIRVQIDEVDTQIRDLFIRRMELAREVARVKSETEDEIYKPDREQSILDNQSSKMPHELTMEYRALLKRTMEISRKYQYGLTLTLRDCFPFSYETKLRQTKDEKTGVLQEETYLAFLTCDGDMQQFKPVRSYDAMARMIRAGELDAGTGVIEHIGEGVSDPLNSMLLAQSFYIHACDVVQDEDEKLKVVRFATSLVVLPEHNRVKVVFAMPNRSGALGSVLSMIADYDVNVTEIHSVPFKEEGGDSWNYRFFLELEMNMLKDTSKALLYQLSCETVQFKLLGSYHCEGDLV